MSVVSVWKMGWAIRVADVTLRASVAALLLALWASRASGAEGDAAERSRAGYGPEAADTRRIQARMADADRAFELGRSALARGDFEEACQRFEESSRHVPSPGTLLNLGDCLERGHLPGGILAALEAFERALLETDRVDSEATRELMNEEAQRRVDALRARLGRLTLQPSSTRGASVRLNGEPLNRLDAALLPGRYQLEVSASGKRPWAHQLELKAGDAVQLALPVLVDERPVIVSTAVEPVTESRRARIGALPFMLAGGATVLGGAWLYAGLTATSKDAQYRELRAQCDSSLCPDSVRGEARAVQRSARAYAQVTDYVLIPAFVATLGGALLSFWLEHRAEGGRSLPSTQLGCNSSGCGLLYTAQF